MQHKNYIQFHFFIIVNNFAQFESNTQLAVNNLMKKKDHVFIHITDNSKSQFKSIRHWLNDSFDEIYSNINLFSSSLVFFVHQDVFFKDNFLDQISTIFLKYNFENAGMYGFAGIDKFGATHFQMKDSNLFCCTGDFVPLKVETVDEFFFAIEPQIFFEKKIFLSNIKGWHAYAAELSIILHQHQINTYYLPVYVEHNSNRTNNFGLTKTHQQIFDLYKTEIFTPAGKIEKKNFYRKLKSNSYSFYVNYIKYKFQNNLIESIKTILLDKFHLNYNVHRIVNKYINSFDEVYFVVLEKPEYFLDTFNFKINSTKIVFKTVVEENELLNYLDKQVIILGFNNTIVGFKQIKNSNIQIKNNS